MRRDVSVRGEYRGVILSMVVIRWLDALLEPTKAEAQKMKEWLEQAKIQNTEAALRKGAGKAFCNASPAPSMRWT